MANGRQMRVVVALLLCAGGATAQYLPAVARIPATARMPVGPPVAPTFLHYRTLTINHTLVGANDSSNFIAAVVSGCDTTMKDLGHGGHVQSSSGNDIQFYADSGAVTQYASTIKYYDNVNGCVTAYVRVPTVSHTSDTVFYVQYDSASPPSRLTTLCSGNSLVSFWPLGNGTSLSGTDLCGTQNGTVHNATATTGIIDGGGSFDGSTTWIDMGQSVSALHPSSVTVEAWVEPTNSTQVYYAGIVSQDFSEPRTAPYTSYKLGVNTPPWINTFEFEVGRTDGATQLNAGSAWSSGTWYHVAGTFDGGGYGLILYVNGANVASGTTSGVPIAYSNGNFRIGANSDGGEIPAAAISDVRVSSVVRSADWILAEYNNGNAPGSIATPGFLSWGTEH